MSEDLTTKPLDNEVKVPTFAIKERRGLAVWVYTLKQVKALRHYGTIHYASRKMKYVVLYVDADVLTETVEKIKKLRFVKRVSVSPRFDLATTYGKESALVALQNGEENTTRGDHDARH